MSVFLTPEGKPFYGGTYYPPVRRYNLPSFNEILLTVSRLWNENRGQLLESSEKISGYLLQQASNEIESDHLRVPNLDPVTRTLAQSYDWKYGGWGQAPKFPQPMVIEYLLRRGIRGDQAALDMAIHALNAMAKGGMYDVVGGGFARYSVDNQWHTPHFEKMLYDNALLAQVYLHAFVITDNEAFRRVCVETLDFVLREMTHSQGGFFSSLDADSEGEEGKFYIWTPKEIQETFEDPIDSQIILAAYGVTESGNFEGGNILQRVMTDEQLSMEFDIPVEGIPSRLARLHRALLKTRTKRIRPATDDKVLVFWNAMMLTAFAEAGRYLKQEDYTRAAIQNATFLTEKMYHKDRLLRSWRKGKSRHNAYLEDYAGLIHALLSLYQSDPQPKWYQSALRLADEMNAHFSDPNGGFFDTCDDHENLLFRPKDLQDNATPSGNALATMALLQLAAYGDRPSYRDIAEKNIASISEMMTRYPTAFAQWLISADYSFMPTYEVALLGDKNQLGLQEMVDALWQTYRPHMVTSISDYPPSPNSPILVKNRPLLNGKPTAYVCQNHFCQQPVNSSREMEALLE